MRSGSDSVVSFVKVRGGMKGLRNAVERALEEARATEYIRGNGIFIKVNAVSAFTIPGQNTSPWVLDALLRVLRDMCPGAEVLVGDGESAARRQVDRGKIIWGYERVVSRHEASFVNLSEMETVKVPVDSEFLKELEVPKILREIDTFLTLPVMKTHTWAYMTCALKNQLGCIPRFRHRFHLFLDEVIVDINQVLRPDFVLIDGTIALEAGGPVIGRPKVCDVLMASPDLVAADTVTARYMGLELDRIGYIRMAEEKGLGSIEGIEIVGDHFDPNPFHPPVENPTSVWHKKLRHSAWGRYLFETFFFSFLAWVATSYQVWWFVRRGRKLAREVLSQSNYGGYLEEIRSIYPWV